MKRLVLGLCLAAIASPAMAAPAVRACDVKLNVIDPDPAGLNVRAAPKGQVIGVLKARNQWVQAHVTGDAGGWMRIDGATLYDDALPEGEKPVFSGQGFVASGMLGIETLNPGAKVYADPSEASRVVYRTPMDDDMEPATKVIGCAGDFLQLQIGTVVGWTRGYCSNQRTTCV
jgi:hypothetical protein